MEKTKNTFQDGLIMDFSPDNTSATSLTSALNATILTFNGNEMALQNDMGNGRVETAYLPEGYIPVGTCEFGDIIYIASYNPLTNRSLIGCFPSPERNISSEELGGLQLSLSYTDFQILAVDKDGLKLDLPSGELKSTAVRKVLIDNRNTNPGDKYIVFSELASENFEKFGQLSDFKILDEDNKKVKKEFNFKKYLKLSVVSIDETGKITYLDTDTHYYQYYIDNEINEDGSPNNNKAVYTTYDHFISPKMIQHGTDVDEYRNMLLSGWNIFSSKNPGKLAILAELNTIDTFSCTYEVIVDEIEATKDDLGNTTDEGVVKYTVYFTPIFDDEKGLKKVYLSRENVNKEVRDQDGNITGYEFKIFQDLYDKSEKDPLYIININQASDTSLIPNYHSTSFDYFGGPITDPEPEPVVSGESYLAFEVVIPRKNGELIKSEDLIYSCDIIPAMPFGKLDYLKVPITIDFNRIGSGDVGLTRWRYYNYGTLCTLQYGLEIYNKPNEHTKSVTIDFYDNNGHVARYTLENLDSFSGVRTEYLGLNGENYNYRLNKMVGDEYILHKALEYRNFDINTDTITYWEGEDLKYIGKDPNGNIQSTDLSSLGPGLYLLSMVDNTLIDGSYLVEKKDDTLKIYTNDAGTLYANLLYAALITVTSDKGSEPKRYWRWLWTNNMYNEYYYQVDDFNNLKFLLDLDVNAIFEAGQTYLWNDITLNNLDNNIDNGCYNTYSANVVHIGQEDEYPNVNLYAQPGLLNDYGCFNLITKDFEGRSQLEKFGLDIYLGKSKISYSNYEDNYEYSMTNIPLMNIDKLYLSLSEITDYSNTLKGTENREYIERVKAINVNNITLKDTFNLRFKSGEGEPIQLEDEDETVTAIPLHTTLSNCYYANSVDKNPIQLILSASIFTKAFTCSTLKYTGECPTYSPIISNELELNGYGILGIETSGTAFLRMNTAFMGMVGGADNEYSFAGMISNNNIFDRTDRDDDAKDNKIVSPNSFNSYGNNDYVSKYNETVESLLNKFFIYYPGGDKECTFTSIRGNSGFEEARKDLNKAYPSLGNLAERKKYCILFTRSLNSGKLPDIEGTKLHYIEDHSAVGILCMKHPSGGFIAFNTIYLDYDKLYSNGPGNVVDGISGTSDYGTSYPQTGSIDEDIDYTQYPNFSYPLYLILSRVYTKNKTIPSNGESVRLSNYVRRGQYSTTLTKDVIMKLYLNSEDVNIAMSGIDYNQYKDALLEVINNIQVGVELKPNVEALKLIFSDCAKNTVLTLEVNNKQIEFPDIENMALLSYNGSIVPCEKILDNLFYIYYEGKLIPYYDLEYKFDKQTIINNLSHLLGKPITDINYMTNSQTLLAPLEIELAADDLANAYSVFYATSEFTELVESMLEETRIDSEEQAKDHIIKLLENCFTSGNERFYYSGRTYSTPQEPYLKWKLKYPTIDMWNVLQYATNDAGKNMYEYLKNTITLIATANRTYEFQLMLFNFKHGDKYLLDLITITPLLGLSENFEYSNSLELKSNAPHNMLKICLGAGDENLGDRLNGLLCIMKDVSVDITHRITEN